MSDCSKSSGCHAVSKLFATLRLCVRQKKESRKDAKTQREVELKSVDKLAKVHKKQLLTYLRLMDRKLGLLINFGENLIKDGISRVVNGLDD